jgi:hypothetical protein
VLRKQRPRDKWRLIISLVQFGERGKRGVARGQWNVQPRLAEGGAEPLRPECLPISPSWLSPRQNRWDFEQVESKAKLFGSLVR